MRSTWPPIPSHSGPSRAFRQECCEGDSAPLLKLCEFWGADTSLYQTYVLSKGEEREVHYYQQKNARTQCWLSPCFDTFTSTAVTSKLLLEMPKWAWSKSGPYISHNRAPFATVSGFLHHDYHSVTDFWVPLPCWITLTLS